MAKLLFYLGVAGILSSYISVAHAEYIFNKDSYIRLGVGGYTRGLTGKMEGYKYNNVSKSEGYIKPYLDLTDDLTISGRVAARYIVVDRFAKKNKLKFYDVYGSIISKSYGTLDVGNLHNVAYKLHMGPVDVGLLSIDDSDISYFYNTPKGFWAPTLSYLATDSRDTKISYTSPRIKGFKWGLTAVQSEDKKPDKCAPLIKEDHGKGLITALQYQTKIQNIRVGLSGGYAKYFNDRYYVNSNTLDADHDEFSVGSRIRYNAYSVGATYRQMMFSKRLNIKDTHTWIIGGAYDDKKYGLSLNYLRSQASHTNKNTFSHLMMSGKYQFNEYIKTTVSVGRLLFLSNAAKSTNRYFGIAGIEFKT